MTPDQPRAAADELLRPSVNELGSRKKKLHERLSRRSRFFVDNIPVVVGVVVTVASMNYLTESGLLAVLTGIAAANMTGAFIWRRN
jgi:hypothetical protein